MNRKLLVIAMVPLLVGFAGAMAFSSWDASVSKTISVTTGTVALKEKVECVGAYIEGTITVYYSWASTGPNGKTGSGFLTIDGNGKKTTSPQCPQVTECYTVWCGDPGNPSLGEFEFLGPGITGASYTLWVNGLSPGDWIELEAIDSLEPTSTLSADLTSTLSPSALAGYVAGSPLTFTSAGAPLGPSQIAAPAAGGWTWLDPPATNPCYDNFVVGPTALPLTYPEIGVGEHLSAHPNLGLEYCDSGPLAPAGNPELNALAPAGGPVTLGSSPSTYAYILFGLDESAAGLSNSGMGMTGSLVYTVNAVSP